MTNQTQADTPEGTCPAEPVSVQSYDKSSCQGIKQQLGFSTRMTATQELPLDLSTQYALATTTAAVSPSSQQDNRPQQRKEIKVQRSRKAFSSLQLDELKRWIQQNQYPSRKETTELASSLELTAFQVGYVSTFIF